MNNNWYKLSDGRTSILLKYQNTGRRSFANAQDDRSFWSHRGKEVAIRLEISSNDNYFTNRHFFPSNLQTRRVIPNPPAGGEGSPRCY
jgi:hypothetical protein